jgi:hypothetical protein
VANPAAEYWGARLVDFGFPYLLSLYLGAATVLLAVGGCLGSRGHAFWRSMRWALGGLAGLGLVVACGRHLPLVGTVLAATPGIDLVRYPIKALLLAGLPVALLAGRGVDVLAGGEPRTRAMLRGTAAASALGLGLASALSAAGLAGPVLEVVFENGGAQAAAGLPRPLLHAGLALGGLAVATLASGERRRAGLVSLLVLVDLVAAGAAALPMAPKDAFPTPPRLAVRLGEHLEGGRFVRDRDPSTLAVPLAVNRAWAVASWWYSVVDGAQGANWGLPMVYHSDAEVLAGRRIADIASVIWSLPWEERIRLFRVAGADLVMTPDRPRLPELEEVAVLPTAATELVYRLYRLRPGVRQVWWVPTERTVLSSDEALRTIRAADFDPSREVVRELPSVTGHRHRGLVGALVPGAGLWTGEVVAPADGMLVTALPWHPDLVLEIDGRAVRSERLNYSFTGAAVEAGTHGVRIVFAPCTVLWGGVLSLLGFLMVASLAAAPRLRSRWTRRG